jgi:hypothetical protein
MNIDSNLMAGSGLLDHPIPVENDLPPQGRWVLVLTPKYRCLGYRQGGVWRDVMHGRRIDDPVLCWMPAEE